MSDSYTIKPIARIYTDFHERFGIPRQAGLAEELTARIVFEPEFRTPDAVKGLDTFSYLWLIWSFSETKIDMSADHVKWSPLVTPPRLGGKIKEGVFATRSPYRPNSMGLSSVRLISVDLESADAPAIIVGGADILNGTAIFDIKPYLPYTDCHPDAENGFAVPNASSIKVDFPEELKSLIVPEKLPALLSILSQDPRGAYEKQPGYQYGLRFSSYDIRFTVNDGTLHVFQVITVKDDYSKIK